MPRSTPLGSTFNGWFYDQVGNQLKLYVRGTLVRTVSATADTVPSTQTVNFDGPVDMDNTFNIAGGTATPNLKQNVVQLGTAAAVASDGAGAILPVPAFVAPYDLVISSVWRVNNSASDVTAGTAVSSASYRRNTLITNTAGTGSGTNVVASLNATASAASNATRSFTIAASTVPAGAIIRISHLTVGANTADGTDMAQATFIMAYERA